MAGDPCPKVYRAPKARKRVNPVSARRRAAFDDRAYCVQEVRILARGRCEYADLWPDVPCGWLPERTVLEVDEIRGGSWRVVEWTDPHRCRLTCPVHHDVKTDSKDHALVERIETETRRTDGPNI
jgi:hypothetical protein